MFLLLLSFLTLAHATDFKQHDQRYCAYWLKHLDEVGQREKALIEARQSRRAWIIWKAKRKLKRKLLECEWQTFDFDTFESELPDLPEPEDDFWKKFGR